METEADLTDDTATLDPPGSIAVIGAGPLGIEAALYGRYLGYDVTLIEAVEVAHRFSDRRGEPIPMLPDRSVSPLAWSALAAQSGNDDPKALPLSIGAWIDQVWMPLTETDLMRGRLRCPLQVISMEQVAVDDDPEVPPDFRLRFDDQQTGDFEAVIEATGEEQDTIDRSFSLPIDYHFRIGRQRTGDAEADLWTGFKEIVAVYASLGGRAELDLYQPLRG